VRRSRFLNVEGSGVQLVGPASQSTLDSHYSEREQSDYAAVRVVDGQLALTRFVVDGGRTGVEGNTAATSVQLIDGVIIRVRTAFAGSSWSPLDPSSAPRVRLEGVERVMASPGR